jgi:organic hydroperoxide reductase OsmC/OhrA
MPHLIRPPARGSSNGRTLRAGAPFDIDLHAFLGLGKGRPGFTEIRVRSRVKSPNATREQLEELCQYVQDTSPVRDILANPVPVHTNLEVL